MLDIEIRGVKNWRHLASFFMLSFTEVECLALEYKKDGGSPTKELLKKLMLTRQLKVDGLRSKFVLMNRDDLLDFVEETMENCSYCVH